MFFYSGDTNIIYDVRDIVTSDSSGQIVIGYSGDAGPFYNGLIVQQVSAAPEPDTFALLLGGLVMMGFTGRYLDRRRRFTAK